MAKIILGLDPGIADTGYGVIKYDRGKLSCLDYGSIKTKATNSLSNRLEILDKELEELIKHYQPDVVAVEQLFFNKNTKAG